MTQQRNDFKAGLFILVSLALIITIVVGIKGIGRLLEPSDARVARFSLMDNVGGLRSGDDVRVGGLKVGSVRSIDFEPSTGTAEQGVIVRFSLPRRIQLREGARIVVESTITGSSNLNVEDVGSGQPLPPEAMLVGRGSGLTALLSGAGGVIADVRAQTVPRVNTTVDNINGLVTDVRAKVEPGYQKFAGVADRGSEALTNIRDVFGDTKTDFRTTMANLSASTTAIREKISPILEKFDSGLAKAGTSLDKVNASLDDIKAVAADARDITGNVRGILNNNRSRIEAMIASLKSTGENLKGASSEIRRSPWRLIYKPGAGEQANLNLFDSAREFAEGAGDLNDAASALRDALKNPNVDAEHVNKLVQQLDLSFQKFTKVENQLWEQVKE